MRLEFIGDTIESLRTYDPATQRSIAPIDQLAIVPLRDVLPSSTAGPNSSATDTAGLRPATTVARRTSVLPIWIARRPSSTTWRARATRASSCRSATKSTHRSRSCSSSFSTATTRRSPERLAARRAVRRSRRHRRPTRSGDDDLAARPRRRHRRSRRPDRRIRRIPNPDPESRPIRCQPAVEMHGRVADWVAEIRRLREGGETTLFVAATPGRAERTIELLKEYEVLARSGRARGRCALRRGARRPRQPLARIPAAGRRRCRSTPRRTSSRRIAARRSGAVRRPKRFSPTCAISRSAISSSTSITASAMFVGLKQIGVGDSDAGVSRAALRRRRQAVRPGRAARSRAEVHRRDEAAGRSARRRVVGARENQGQEGDARHGGGAAQALRRAQGRAGARLRRRLALAAGIRRRVRIRAHRRSEDGDRRHQARHGVADADGPSAVRRRRLRQDRSRHARRVQGGDGRQAGRVSGADHGARLPAREDPEGALRRLPRPHRRW